MEHAEDCPARKDDSQCRYIEVIVGGVQIAVLYLPTGNPRPGPRFDYKLRWLDRLHDRLAGLIGLDAPVVIAGDFNVLPTDLDGNAGSSPTEEKA